MSIFKGLGWLFRSLWRLLNFTRLMLVNLLFLIVVLVIVFSVSQKEAPQAPIEGALTLNLNGVLVEQRSQTESHRTTAAPDGQQRRTAERDRSLRAAVGHQECQR